MKKYWKNIVELIVLSIFIYKFLDVSFILENEFNLITVNTVLVGFLFTIYTILIPLLDEESMEVYEKTKEIEKVFKNITLGIVYGILSVLFTIAGLAIFGNTIESNMNKYYRILLTIDLSFFILIMKSTLLAIIDISSIVGYIRRNKNKKIAQKRANEEINRRFINKK
ncbi:MAG: hypothetical protein ACLR3R_08535 [Clostridium paraputrificum]